MNRRVWLPSLLILFLLALSGCGESPSSTEKKLVSVPAPPTDEARRFPSENQRKIELTPDHLLGKSFLPGGNVAEYSAKNGKTYQQFLINAGTPAKASFLLMDFKGSLTNAKYLAHIGGYLGQDSNGQPVYVFAKDRFLAGFVGLSEQEAEPLARRFATALF